MLFNISTVFSFLGVINLAWRYVVFSGIIAEIVTLENELLTLILTYPPLAYFEEFS